jgi:hypothetical protein
LDSFKLNTINYAQAVCLARGRLLLGVYLKTSPFKPVLMERQHLRFLHRPRQKQHSHLGQVVQTQTSLVLLVVLVVTGEGIEGNPNSSGIEAGSTIANAISAIAPGFADSLGISPGFTNEAGGFSQGPSGGSEGDSEASQSADGNSERKTGGLIRMAEGGGPPKMAELSAKPRRVLRLTSLNILTMRGAWLAATQSPYTTRIELLQGTTIDPTNVT